MTVAPHVSRMPRPLTFIASIIGLIMVVLALPVVLLAGGPIGGWLLGAALWSANWGAQLLTAKFALGMSATYAVGVSGVSFISRAWLVAIVLFVFALKFDETAGLTAAGVFLVAFTADLMGRTLLFSTRERDRQRAADQGVAE